MALLKINGVDMPTPSGYLVGIQDISNAVRNARGNMIKEQIATKAKIDLSWIYLSAVDTAKVLTAVSGNFFTVEYLDPKANAFLTKTFYVGDRTAPIMDFLNGIPRYKDIKFNIIEK